MAQCEHIPLDINVIQRNNQFLHTSARPIFTQERHDPDDIAVVLEEAYNRQTNSFQQESIIMDVDDLPDLKCKQVDEAGRLEMEKRLRTHFLLYDQLFFLGSLHEFVTVQYSQQDAKLKRRGHTGRGHVDSNQQRHFVINLYDDLNGSSSKHKINILIHEMVHAIIDRYSCLICIDAKIGRKGHKGTWQVITGWLERVDQTNDLLFLAFNLDRLHNLAYEYYTLYESPETDDQARLAMTGFTAAIVRQYMRDKDSLWTSQGYSGRACMRAPPMFPSRQIPGARSRSAGIPHASKKRLKAHRSVQASLAREDWPVTQPDVRGRPQLASWMTSQVNEYLPMEMAVQPDIKVSRRRRRW